MKKPNKYPGACYKCEKPVKAQAGGIGKAFGKWRVYCAEHAPDEPEKRGRIACDNAPMCGCCY